MRYTNRERYEAIQLVRGRGMALREVGSTCGVFRTTVGRWYREDGIPFAHGPHGRLEVLGGLISRHPVRARAAWEYDCGR